MEGLLALKRLFLPSNSSLSARGTLDTRLPPLHTHCTLSTTLVVHATAACKTQRLARLSSPPTPPIRLATLTTQKQTNKARSSPHAPSLHLRRYCKTLDGARADTPRKKRRRDRVRSVSALSCACQTPLTTPFATYPDTVSVCAPTARNRPKKRGARRCVSL